MITIQERMAREIRGTLALDDGTVVLLTCPQCKVEQPDPRREGDSCLHCGFAPFPTCWRSVPVEPEASPDAAPSQSAVSPSEQEIGDA